MRTARASPAWSARLPVLYGGLGLVAVAIFVTLPADLESAVMYDAIAGSCVLAILAGTWIHRPARPLPWRLLAAGFACFVAGEITWHVYRFGLGQDPFPSVADVFYLAGYPLLAAGLLLLARDRGAERGHERDGVLDAADRRGVRGLLGLPRRPVCGRREPLDDRSGVVGGLPADGRPPAHPARPAPLRARTADARGVAPRARNVLQHRRRRHLPGPRAGGPVLRRLGRGDLAARLPLGRLGGAPSVDGRPAGARAACRGPHALAPRRPRARGRNGADGPGSRGLLRLDRRHRGHRRRRRDPPLARAAAARRSRPRARARGRRARAPLRERACRAGRGRGGAAAARGAERPVARARPVEGRVRRPGLARAADAADLDHRVPGLVLDDPDLAEGHRRFLDVVDRNADRLLRLVSDLLLVAQIESGRLTLDLDDVDIAAVASESVEALRPAADAQEIDLGLDLGPVPSLRGDRARLGQLLDNLVSNAVKFTDPGGRVVVALRRNADGAVVTVSDDGIGIPAAEQRRLFDRFFRASTAQARAIDGTGLGLTIARAIVTVHGGTVDLTSAEGEGTTFRVRLPLAGPAAHDAVGSSDRPAESVI